MPTHHNKIGVATATIIGMNAMIGAGIFSVPAALGSYVGPAGLLTYLFVIIAVWFMGTSLARLAYLYPQEGSFYTYAYQWGGHVAGLLTAGSYLIGLIIAMGLLTQMAGSYIHDFFPLVCSFSWGVIVLISLVLFNIFGVTISQIGQIILIICTIAPIILTTLICLLHGSSSNLYPFFPYGMTNVLSATKAVIFGFFGFECAASLFTIVDHPEKNVPRALRYSIVLVGILYTAFVGSIIYAVPASYFINPDLSLRTILENVLPGHTWLLTLIQISILSAILGTIHSMIWSASTLLLAYLHKWKSPFIKNAFKHQWITNRNAIVAMGIAIVIPFAAIKSIGLFFSLTAIFLISAFISAMITLLCNKKEWESGQNIKTILGLITALVILYFSFEEVFFLS